MTREEAYKLADELIPNVWGSMRAAWVHGFIDGRAIGIHRYPRTSVCWVYMNMGKTDRKNWEDSKS